MADIAQLLQKILSDPKIATNSNFASKVYNDEPILITAPQMEKFTPPKIREMRQLARGDVFGAKVFYEQGVFMESFEDNFDYRGEFAHYFPTYQHMTDVQLRGYFSWRAKVRAGVIAKTSLSFAFVYIYELLNGIGVPSPLDGYFALKNFWTAYGEIDSRISNYVEIWLKDYVVYHDLDKALLEGLPDVAFDNALAVLLGYKERNVDEVFSALNAISSYDLENSRFFKQHPDDVKQVVHRVFSVISDYHNRNPQKGAREKLFGRMCDSSYSMFKAAVFHHRVIQRDRVYEIGLGHKYMCLSGSWSCERFLWYGNNNKRIGALLKTVDFLMRQQYGFSSTLQTGKTNKVIKGKIEKEIARFLDGKRKPAVPTIDIDTSKLQHIRKAALATQSKLLVDEAETEEPPEIAKEETISESATVLNDAERRFMHCLLHGEAYGPLLQTKGLMLSVLIDGINEKLFDMFGDTVIIHEGDEPVVVEDYAEEVKGLIDT